MFANVAILLVDRFDRPGSRVCNNDYRAGPRLHKRPPIVPTTSCGQALASMNPVAFQLNSSAGVAPRIHSWLIGLMVCSWR